jgi:DNA-binding ferritin-like protein
MIHKGRMLKRDPEMSNNGMSKPMVKSNDAGSYLAMTLGCLLKTTSEFHKLHLKVNGTGAFAQHMALGELYEALPGLIDTVLEGYQGAAETILEYPETPPVYLKSVEQALDYMREKCEHIHEAQEMIPYSEVVNNLDLIKDAINKAKYKLLFLK